jgi:hypothetical protein
MNNDKKTTLMGFIQAGLIAVLAGFSYFGGADVTAISGQVNSSGDWGALILTLFAIFTFIKGYFTNKPEEKK